MKLSKVFSTAFAALTLMAGSVAFAQVTTFPTMPLVLDPALNQAGFAGQTVCDGPGFPACANANINSSSTYTITFTHGGLFSSSIIPAVVDPDNGTPANEFTVLNYTIFNPSAVPVLSNITSESNLAVIAGTYTIQVFYHFVGTPTATSAAWAMPLTTGPARLVPEPGTLALLGLGLAMLGFTRRKNT